MTRPWVATAAVLVLVVMLSGPSLLALESGRLVEGPVRLAFSSVEADPARHTLLILDPSVAFGEADVRALRAFLLEGGHALVADDGAIGFRLLQDLAVGVELTTTPVYSPDFQDDPSRVLSRATALVPGLPPIVALSQPVLVRGGEPVLRLPPLAWADANANRRPDLDEPLATGSFAALARVGDGMLLVLGDADLAQGGSETARALLAFATEEGARELVLDRAHDPRSDPMGANALLAGRLGLASAAVLLAAAALAVALVSLRPRLRPKAASRPRHVAARSEAARLALEELDPS